MPCHFPNTILKTSVSLTSIWQSIRLHYGFQTTGAHFLDFNNIQLEAGKRHEDLYQRLISLLEDNLLMANGTIHHYGVIPDHDGELSPSLKNMIELTWLQLIHQNLPNLVKQRYATELRSHTLNTLTP